MKQVGIAVIGCGSFGTEMGAFLARWPDYRIAGVFDRDPELARELARGLEAEAFPSFEQALATPGVAAVGLFTPNSTHASLAIAALAAGKHVFCEKPMASTVAECQAMISAAESAGLVLMVGHKRRFRPAYVCIAELVASARYGRIVTAHCQGFYDRTPVGWWASRAVGGGLLQFAGVHDLDFLRSIAGEATSVVACAPMKVHEDTDFEDAITMVISYASGAIASLSATWLFTGVPFRDAFGIQIALEHGSISYDPARSFVEARGADGTVEHFEFDRDSGFEPAFRREFASFAASVRDGAPPIVTGLDGLRCVELMEAAERSIAVGAPVALPLDVYV
jgi:predicted dehydrogenase